MPKIHVVKEQFSLDGKDYPRGSEISDAALVEIVRKRFPKHVVPQHHEAVATVAKSDDAPKAEAPAAAAK